MDNRILAISASLPQYAGSAIGTNTASICGYRRELYSGLKYEPRAPP